MTGPHRARLRAVVFDLDDTLLDHQGAVRDALREWAPRWGRQQDLAALVADWFGLERSYYPRFQAGELTVHQQRRARVRAFLPHVDLRDDAAVDDAFDGYWQAYERSWRLLPDAADAVTAVRVRGLDVAVLTNGRASDQRRKVVATGLDVPQERVFPSSELPAAKPHVAAFRSVQDALGADADELLMVGDNASVDVAGAIAAGWYALLVDRARPDTDSGSAYSVITSLAEMDRVLDRHMQSPQGPSICAAAVTQAPQ